MENDKHLFDFDSASAKSELYNCISLLASIFGLIRICQRPSSSDKVCIMSVRCNIAHTHHAAVLLCCTITDASTVRLSPCSAALLALLALLLL
jgi:hypothetical protein